MNYDMLLIFRQHVKKLKSELRKILPVCILKLYCKASIKLRQFNNEGLSIRDIFTNIYQNNEWGGEPGQYYSGSGSSEYHAIQYAEVIKKFIRDRNVATVLDLGCGDFTVGSKLQIDEVKYIGIDIVDNLIKVNQEKYQDKYISFKCLDIISDELPNADLCLIRQVLQHLSNSQIQSVLQNTKKYKYVIITEYYPAPSVKCRLNIDKTCGSHIRIHENSAVYLDKEPFNMQNPELIHEIEAQDYILIKGEMIRTFLIEN